MINNFNNVAINNEITAFNTDSNETAEAQVESFTDYQNLESQNNLQISSATKVQQKSSDKLTCFYKRQAVYVVEAENEQEKQAVISHYLKLYPQDLLVQITNPEDLNTNNIIKKIIYTPDSKINISSGYLLDSQPLTFVMDLSAMIASEISSLNELLDTPPKYMGSMLHNNIRIVIIITDEMLYTTTPNSPGADCWRRLQQIGKFNLVSELAEEDDFNYEVVDNDTLLQQNITKLNEIPNNLSNHIIIDFMENQNFEQLLYGAIVLNESGKLIFEPSKLIAANKNYTIILQNAPWNNVKFKASIADLLRYKKISSNCQQIKLAENVNFASYDIDSQELCKLKQQYLLDLTTINFSELTNYICLNSISIEQVFANVKYTYKGISKTNRLLNIANTCEYILLTDELENKQWLRLISLLNKTPKQIKIIQLTGSEKLPINKNLKLVSYTNEELMLTTLKPNYDISYQLTASTTWENIWQMLEMSSQNNLKFKIQSNKLLQAATAGKRVLFYGYEKNIEVIKNLESLLANKPYIFIHGNKIALANLQLTLAIKHEFASNTALWQQLANSNQQLQIDVSNNQYQALFFKIAQLPRCEDKKYSNKQPWGNTDFNQLVEKQVVIEMQKNNSEQATTLQQQQALDLLIAEQYKEDLEIYSYIKILIAQYCQTLNTTADKQQLANWLTANPQATRNHVSQNFWQLLNYCPLKDFEKFIPTSFDAVPNNLQQDGIDIIIKYLIQAAPESKREYWQRRFAYDKPLEKIDKLAIVTANKAPKILELQQQKLEYLTNLLNTHPIVFFKGDAGSGKSFMAQRIAEKLQQTSLAKQSSITLNMGPATTIEDIFRTCKLNKQDNDTKLEYVDGPILAWAQDPCPPVLILDEANIAPEGLLAPLSGLTLTPPSIDFQGEKYPLTSKHRVILTGNFNSYSGRNMDSALNAKALCIHFDTMGEKELTELIIKPNLPINWNQAVTAQAIKQINWLYSYYNNLYDNSLSARDLHSILTRLKATLSFNQSKYAQITTAQINSLVWLSFFDTLATELSSPKNTKKLEALTIWYRVNHELDNSIFASQELAFNRFLTELRRVNPDIDLFIKPITNLVREYWLFLQASPRRGMIVEGPAGYGKDCVLSRVLKLWQLQQHDIEIIYINANPNNVEQLINSINDAKDQGKIIAISELNLLPSNLLEGMLNNVLTGESHVDFKLFATINSASKINGRQELSSALKNRCTKVKLANFTRDDYYQLLTRRSANIQANNYLATYFFVLDQQLEQEKSVIQLCIDDLFRVADAIVGLVENLWQGAIQKQLPLATSFIGNKQLTQAITEYNNIATANMDSTIIAISEAINNNQPEPIVVNLLLTTQPFFDVSNKEITLEFRNNSSITDYINTANWVINETITPKVYKFSINKTAPTLHCNEYFNTTDKHYAADYYRLEVKQLIFNNGQLTLIANKFIPGSYLKIPAFPSQQVVLSSHEQIGAFTIKQADGWQVLPGFTANDSLKYLNCNQNLLITRCKNSGQIYVKINIENQVADTLITFLISTAESYFQYLKTSDKLAIKESCNLELKQWLDENIFDYKKSLYAPCKQLQFIKQIANKVEQINALVSWCKTFDASKYIDIKTTQNLQAVIYNKIGVCRHRALVFLVFADYFNIKARMITNQLHAFIEVQLQNGFYKKLDFGGGPATIKKTTISPNKINYKKITNTNVSKLHAYIDKHLDAGGHFINEKYFERELARICNGEFLYISSSDLVLLFNKFNFYNYFIEYIKNGIATIVIRLTNKEISEIDELKRILGCFYYLFQIKQQILITEDQYNQLLAIIMDFPDIISTSYITPILEYLTQIPTYSIQAQKQLTNYYECLTKHQQVPTNIKEITPKDKLVIKLPKYDLATILLKNKVDKKWSYINKGKAPEINRLIELKPPFSYTVISGDSIVFIPLDLNIYSKLYYACKNNFKICGAKFKRKNFHHIANSFFEFLFSSLNKDKIKIIAFIDEIYTDPITEEKIKITKGTYEFLEALNILIYRVLYVSCANHYYEYYNFDRKINYEYINIKTLREIYNEPTAVMLDDETLQKPAEIFLKSINFEKLAKSMHLPLNMENI